MRFFGDESPARASYIFEPRSIGYHFTAMWFFVANLTKHSLDSNGIEPEGDIENIRESFEEATHILNKLDPSTTLIKVATIFKVVGGVRDNFFSLGKF